MTKKELIQLFNEGKLEVKAISINGFQVVEVIHGFEDKVFGFYEFTDGKAFSLVKVHYSTRAYINVFKSKIYMDEIIKY
jgi:hypothetical protein